jgi:hypothetical protein
MTICNDIEDNRISYFSLILVFEDIFISIASNRGFLNLNSSFPFIILAFFVNSN